MRFTVVAEYMPGKDIVVVDALSRGPLEYEQLNRITSDVEEYVKVVQAAWPATDEILDQSRQGTREDVHRQHTVRLAFF